MDMDKYLSNGIISQVWNEKIRAEAGRKKESMSNLLRVLLLYSHGGAHFDTDTISQKAIPEDIPNFSQIGEEFISTFCILAEKKTFSLPHRPF